MPQPDIDALIADVLAKHAAWQKAGIEKDEGRAYRVAAANAAPVLARELKKCREALKPFADFAKAWNDNPINGLDDELYSIHAGDIRGVIKLSDCQTALAALTPEAITNDPS